MLFDKPFQSKSQRVLMNSSVRQRAHSHAFWTTEEKESEELWIETSLYLSKINGPKNKNLKLHFRVPESSMPVFSVHHLSQGKLASQQKGPSQDLAAVEGNRRENISEYP